MDDFSLDTYLNNLDIQDSLFGVGVREDLERLQSNEDLEEGFTDEYL